MVTIPVLLFSLPDIHKMRNFMKNELHDNAKFFLLRFRVGDDTPFFLVKFPATAALSFDPENFYLQVCVCSLSSLLKHPSRTCAFSGFWTQKLFRPGKDWLKMQPIVSVLTDIHPACIARVQSEY